MPASNIYKKQRRSGSYNSSARYARQMKMTKVPRAISTRGTKDGYYEIPCTQLIRLYCNTSSGFWGTDQVSMAPIGTTGWSGMGIYFKNDNTYINFGSNGSGGAIASVQNFGVRDFVYLGQVFDDMKVAKINVEVWMNTDPSAVNHTLGNAPEIWMAFDGNDAYPPNQEIQEYAKSVRVLPNRKTSFSFTPSLMLDTASDAGTGTTTGPGVTQASTYVRTNSTASLYGLKIFNWLPYEPSTAHVYYFHMKITQIRRFRRQK